MNHHIKKCKFVFLLLASLLLLFSSSCSVNPDADKNGEMLFLSKDEMIEQGREGIFVLNEDDTFTPVISQFHGYQGEILDISNEENLSARFIWFTNNTVNISKLIPTVNRKSSLVAFYNTTSSMPSTYTLEKYDYKGYTIGCHIYKDSDGALYISKEDMIEDSDVSTFLSELDENSFQIAKVNERAYLPLNNVDNNMQILLGLEKGKYYKFEFYKGTRYMDITTVADTQVLQSSKLILLQNPYKRTAEGYFKINLPSNLSTGYYYICGVGMFKYEQ